MTKTEALLAARRIIVEINESGESSELLDSIKAKAIAVQGFIYKL
jgi:hypothetical protein